jgi:hypothetical protein
MHGRSLNVIECMELIEEVRLLLDHEEAEYCASQEDQGSISSVYLSSYLLSVVCFNQTIGHDV